MPAEVLNVDSIPVLVHKTPNTSVPASHSSSDIFSKKNAIVGPVLVPRCFNCTSLDSRVILRTRNPLVYSSDLIIPVGCAQDPEGLAPCKIK